MGREAREEALLLSSMKVTVAEARADMFRRCRAGWKREDTMNCWTLLCRL